MYWTYILQSQKTAKYYVGSTSNLDERLLRHNSRKSKYTKHGVPWRLVYQERFPTKQCAYRREMQIKRYKGGEAFKKLLQ